MNAINKCCGAVAEFIIDFSGDSSLAKGYFHTDRKIAKAHISYNLEAHLYNTATVIAICSVAFAFFGVISATTALVWLCASLAGRVLVQRALDESYGGLLLGIFSALHDPDQKTPLDLLFKRYIY